jgi:hypothetical protein
MVISRPRQGAGRLRGCPSRLGAPDLGRRHDPHREASARKNAQHEHNHAYGHLRRSAWPLHVGLDRYHGEALLIQGSAPTSRRKRLGPTRAPCCREITRWPSATTGQAQFIPSGLSVAIHPPSGPLLGVRGCAVQLPRGRSARRPGRCDYAAPDCWGHASEDPGSSRQAPPALGPAHSAPRTRKLRQSKNSLDGRAPSAAWREASNREAPLLPDRKPGEGRSEVGTMVPRSLASSPWGGREAP